MNAAPASAYPAGRDLHSPGAEVPAGYRDPVPARPTPRRPAGTGTAWALAGCWAAWAALRGTGTERGFPLVPALAFTPYGAAGTVVPVAAALWARSLPAAALGATSGAVLAAAVLRRAGGTAPAGTPAAGDREVRLGSVNLLVGRADAAAVVALVRAHRLDVLALQEVTPAAERALLAAGIGELLPGSHVVQARAGAPEGAGGAVFTRLPITGRGAVPGAFEQPTVRLAVAGGPDLEVTAVHSHPPATSPAAVRRWSRDLQALPAPCPDVLRVLAGDYNATPDHGRLRALIARGYTDAGPATGQGLRATWTPLRSGHPRLVLDHVLVDARITVTGYDVVGVPGTDHRALLTRLRLPGDG